MKKTYKDVIAMLFVLVLVLATLTACGSSNKAEVSDKIYLENVRFETQEVAEAFLNAKGIPYTVVDAGTTSEGILAEVIADYGFENGQSGYFVNKDETVVLKVFVYEPGEPEPSAEQESMPTETPDETSLASPTATPSAEASEAPNAVAPDDSDTAFVPKDVSDETIKSIQTYNDYLAMYRAILEDYLANYEAAVKGTILYDKEAFADMKKEYDDSFEQQKDAYGDMGESRLISKDTLVDFLINHRDRLKEYTDRVTKHLG